MVKGLEEDLGWGDEGLKDEDDVGRDDVICFLNNRSLIKKIS